jgi:predicted phage terminase large subunit-like protein
MPMENPLKILRDRNTAKLSTSLADFSQRAWREIEPKSLQWNWHLDLLAEYLQLCVQRKIKRLVVCMPPRSTKSRETEIFMPAWAWQRDPSLRFVFASYSDSLSTELSIVRRNLLSSNWYQSTWPQRVQFAPDQNQKTQYENLAHGQMIATSMTGTVSGKGADILVLDDPLSPQQAFSDVERESVNRDFDSTFRSRLNDPDEGVIIVVMRRLHQMDLVGHLRESEPGVWTELVLPMVAEKNEEIVFPISGRVVKRRIGDLLQPSRFPASWVAREKSVGSYRWNSQYQQHPSPPGGAIFKTAWLQQYEKLPESGRVIMSLDTAFSTKRTADFSACSVWVASKGKFYLAWVWRDRCEYPQLKKVTEELAATWQAETVLIEEKGSGQSLLQSLQQETSLPVVGYKIGAEDKAQRAHGVSALFESGRIFVPKAAPWLADYLAEMEMFPSSAHDDMVDTTTMALAYLRSEEYEHQYPILDMARTGMLARIQGTIAESVQFVTRNVFGKRVENPRDENVDRKALFPVEAQLRGLDVAQINPQTAAAWELPPVGPCPKCKATITVLVGGGQAHCNACGAQWWPDGRAPLVTYAVRSGGYVQRPSP